MKRDATPEELEGALRLYESIYADTRERHAAAVAEGYKAETCLLNGCGNVYLAHHHLTRCTTANCPFRDGQESLLDRLHAKIKRQPGEIDAVADTQRETESPTPT